MEALTLGLLLLAAVLASSLIDQIIPRISLPLIQIAIGLVIALVAGGDVKVTLDPELFLVMFIAPLLYDEAKHADKQALWRERQPVLSLAIGLVVATTLVIGFLLHAFVPSIPLAAAFALGAALGPTDAVAVSSLSKSVDIPKRQASMLKGELLLNDASGIVSFQFAIAAVLTGSFSLVNASVDFLVEFVGGLLLGVVLGLIGNGVVRRARSIGVENTNFHVLFEVLIPFLIYLVANVCHVSGVIAVVVAGLINVTSPKGVIGPSVSRMNIVSGSVWHVLTYALNGIVFVLLGTQLPNAMHDTWDSTRIDNGILILLVLGITALLWLCRRLGRTCASRTPPWCCSYSGSRSSFWQPVFSGCSSWTLSMCAVFSIVASRVVMCAAPSSRPSREPRAPSRCLSCSPCPPTRSSGRPTCPFPSASCSSSLPAA